MTVTDNDFLLHVLRDGFWHAHHEILQRSIRERGYGLTIHSRAADLWKQGHVVECQVQTRQGGARRISFYRLVSAQQERVAA